MHCITLLSIYLFLFKNNDAVPIDKPTNINIRDILKIISLIFPSLLNKYQLICKKTPVITRSIPYSNKFVEDIEDFEISTRITTIRGTLTIATEIIVKTNHSQN